jgi:hypothetical protein
MWNIARTFRLNEKSQSSSEHSNMSPPATNPVQLNRMSGVPISSMMARMASVSVTSRTRVVMPGVASSDPRVTGLISGRPYGCALVCVGQRRGSSDALSGCGDERRFACKSVCQGLLLFA